ncbi:hypothetical protein A9Q78_01245 [Methylophaga sp. 41_12_T18]|nr:hypothetical protein A9Q78_01245 [Methylophaga sp. 41_12_T18]
MATNKITTLSEFLHQTGAKYRVFDIGRRVVKLSPDEFVNFEWAKKPYPYPFQQSALFGVIFWNPSLPDKHYVWFLKFPLDEQGLLIQAARDEFLVMLLDRVGECMLAADDGQRIEGALKDSPYTFTPREDKMAAFNAKATKSLAAKPSKYYEQALQYFTGKADIDSWQSLGMQGVADVAVRLDDNDETLGLIETIPSLPDEPFAVLSTFLEHAEPAAGIVEVLSQRVNMELENEQPDMDRVCACLRAASNSPAAGLVDQMVKRVLQHPSSTNIEVLAIISGRLWRVLEQKHTCHLFLEQLAKTEYGYAGFSQLLADVMFMPGMRANILTALRSPERSDELSRYVGRMFG